jgi:hypothetical protein
MSIDLGKAVGYKFSDKPVSAQAPVPTSFLSGAQLQVSWNKRDLLAYAVGVGAKNNDFSIVYGE